MSLTNGCTIGEDEFGKNSKEVHEKQNIGYIKIIGLWEIHNFG